MCVCVCVCIYIYISVLSFSPCSFRYLLFLHFHNTTNFSKFSCKSLSFRVCFMQKWASFFVTFVFLCDFYFGSLFAPTVDTVIIKMQVPTVWLPCVWLNVDFVNIIFTYFLHQIRLFHIWPIVFESYCLRLGERRWMFSLDQCSFDKVCMSKV